MRCEDIKNPYIEMWTVQTEQVLDTLDKRQVYYVKKKYIQQKYQETAWIFQEAYSFFIREAQKYMPKPAEAESPVWLYYDPMWLPAEAGTHRIRLRIPCEEVLLFDTRTWSKILNLSYVGTSTQETCFEAELRRYGIMHASDVFQQPYYPMQKAKIRNSWQRLFEETCTDKRYMQGASWKLEKSWIVTIDEKVETDKKEGGILDR